MPNALVGRYKAQNDPSDGKDAQFDGAEGEMEFVAHVTEFPREVRERQKGYDQHGYDGQCKASPEPACKKLCS